jgi:hypothetical protein
MVVVVAGCSVRMGVRVVMVVAMVRRSVCLRRFFL